MNRAKPSGEKMKDERAHLQLFDLIARDWMLASPATGVTFNNNDTAVAFACADGAVYLAPTADKEGSNLRVRRAVDTARLTIAPRSKHVPPLKAADFTEGRSSAVVPFGAADFAFAKENGRINSLTPGGISVHLPPKAPGPIREVALSPDGTLLAFACGDQLHVTATDGTRPALLTAPAAITGLGFSPDGQMLAAAHDGGVSRWAVTALHEAALHTRVAGSATGVIWHPGGAWLATGLGAAGFALVDISSDTSLVYGNFPAPVGSIGFGTVTNSVVASGAFRVTAWGLTDQHPITSAKAGLVLISAIATCPTRNLVAVGYANGLLSLAEIGRPSEILLREDTGAGITAMAWSANGKFLGVTGTDGSVALVEFPDDMFKS